MVFYPKVHKNKRAKGMRNLLGLLIAENARRCTKKVSMREFGCEREDAGNVQKFFW